MPRLLLLITIYIFACDSSVNKMNIVSRDDVHHCKNNKLRSENIALIIAAQYDGRNSEKYFNRILQTHFNKSTMLPAYTIISITGIPSNHQNKFENVLNNYDIFDISIYFSRKLLSAAEGKNYAVAQLDNAPVYTEYITFFNLNDIVHPQRMQVLNHIINNNENQITIEGLVHGLQQTSLCKYDHWLIDDGYLSLNFRPIPTVGNRMIGDKDLSSTAAEIADNLDSLWLIDMNEFIEKRYSLEWDPMYQALAWNIFAKKQLKYRIANPWYTIRKSVFYDIGQFETNVYNKVGEDVACTAGTITHGHQLYAIDIPLGLYCK